MRGYSYLTFWNSFHKIAGAGFVQSLGLNVQALTPFLNADYNRE